MRSRAEVMVASVRSCAAPMCATVRNREKKTFLTGEPAASDDGVYLYNKQDP